MDCGYSLELYYIKVGFKGVKVIQAFFRDVELSLRERQRERDMYMSGLVCKLPLDVLNRLCSVPMTLSRTRLYYFLSFSKRINIIS